MKRENRQPEKGLNQPNQGVKGLPPALGANSTTRETWMHRGPDTSIMTQSIKTTRVKEDPFDQQEEDFMKFRLTTLVDYYSESESRVYRISTVGRFAINDAHNPSKGGTPISFSKILDGTNAQPDAEFFPVAVHRPDFETNEVGTGWYETMVFEDDESIFECHVTDYPDHEADKKATLMHGSVVRMVEQQLEKSGKVSFMVVAGIDQLSSRK